MQAAAQEQFISLAQSFEDLNARLVFCELLNIPDDDQIERISQQNIVAYFSPAPARFGEGFYRCLPESGRKDLSEIVTQFEVERTYEDKKTRLWLRINDFFSGGGRDILFQIACHHGIDEDRKLRLMLEWRKERGIPTHEVVAIDEYSSPILDYVPLYPGKRGDSAVLAAALGDH